MTYTTVQAAAEIGLTPGRVRQLARSLGVGRHHGRDWMFSEADIAALRARDAGDTKGEEGCPPL